VIASEAGFEMAFRSQVDSFQRIASFSHVSNLEVVDSASLVAINPGFSLQVLGSIAIPNQPVFEGHRASA
jgi:hypothetical protein